MNDVQGEVGKSKSGVAGEPGPGTACCGPSCCAPEESAGQGAVATAPVAEDIVLQVRERYGRIAKGQDSGCCGASACDTEAAVAGGLGYSREDLASLPPEANLGLGCGAPLAFLGLKPGETAVDLGSGPGLDAFLAARQVGPQGRVIGVDMTPAMLEKARANATKVGLRNVDFREGRLEALPLDDDTVDAVTSNCVINLVPDKGAVFREIARVLRPGGRLVVSDIILDGRLPERLEKDILAYVGCISGAMQRTDYFRLLREAGLGEPEVLRDVNYLATLEQAAPEEARALLARAGVDLGDLQGSVRSITYRAVKPGPGEANAARE